MPAAVPVAALSFVLFSFVGCSRPKSGGAASEESAPEKMSSTELVQADFEKGKLTYDKALLYKVYGVFNQPELPSQYKSGEETRDGTQTLLEIRRNWDKLPKDTREKLEPFFESPLSKNSPLNKAAAALANGVLAAAYAADVPDTSQYNFFDAANGKIKIWYKAADRQKAQWLLDGFNKDKIYETETTLMAREPRFDQGTIGPDNRIDIFLTDISGMGLTVPGSSDANNKCTFHIQIGRKQSREKTLNSAAHELFHGIQFNIDCMESDWWQEETATWCEDFVYPSFEIEQDYLKNYFEKFKMRPSLTKTDGHREYGSYVWPLYLHQKHGAGIIKKLWDACEPINVSAVTAMNNIPGGFEAAFKEFSLWMYNKEPFRYFRDNAQAGKFLSIEPSIAQNRIRVGGNIEKWVNLEPMSLTIEKLYLKPEDKKRIRSVNFDLTFLHRVFPDMGIWAIIKIAGQDETQEDWSGVGYRNYCFDLPEEDLEEIIFIFENPSTTNGKTSANQVDYEAKEYGCEAKLNLCWSTQGGGSGSWEHVYKNSPGYKASMDMHLSVDQRGEVSVSFLEQIVDPDDDEDPESGKQLVPYGGFSYYENVVSGGGWGPVQTAVISGKSVSRCNAGDVWAGNQRSKNGTGLLRLEIVAPDPDQEISQEDMDLIPENMRQQLGQLIQMQESLQQQAGQLGGKQLKPGELKYKIFISLDNLPAESTTSMSDGSTSTEQTTTGSQVDIEGVFKNTDTVIPIDRTIKTEGGSSRIWGTLRLKNRQ